MIALLLRPFLLYLVNSYLRITVHYLYLYVSAKCYVENINEIVIVFKNVVLTASVSILNSVKHRILWFASFLSCPV